MTGKAVAKTGGDGGGALLLSADNRLDAVLAIWMTDLDAWALGDLRKARDRAVAFIQDGGARTALKALQRAATPAEIARAVDRIRQDIPPRGDAVVPNRSIAEEIQAAKPSAAVLEAAVVRLRRRAVFAPAISEVLQAIQEEAGLFGCRVAMLERLPARIREADRALAKSANGPILAP